jgi:hypothetical protein
MRSSLNGGVAGEFVKFFQRIKTAIHNKGGNSIKIFLGMGQYNEKQN